MTRLSALFLVPFIGCAWRNQNKKKISGYCSSNVQNQKNIKETRRYCGISEKKMIRPPVNFENALAATAIF